MGKMVLAKEMFLSLRRRATPPERARRKFLDYFPKGFYDPKYFAWERGYKLTAHEEFENALGKQQFSSLIRRKRYIEIGTLAARIETRTNLLFSFEKMAFRDAVKTAAGAKLFAEGLYDLLYGAGNVADRFQAWCDAVSKMPRKQTRVLTHPVVTVFPFIAVPQEHIFLKPMVTKKAANLYGYSFAYHSRPSWEVYSSLLGFAEKLRSDLKAMKPRDMIDLQSFIWVLGSSEYD